MSHDEAAEVSTLVLPFTLCGYADRVRVNYSLNHDPQTYGFQLVGKRGDLSQGTTRYFAAQQSQAVGVDYLSEGDFSTDGHETHCALLSAGI